MRATRLAPYRTLLFGLLIAVTGCKGKATGESSGDEEAKPSGPSANDKTALDKKKPAKKSEPIADEEVQRVFGYWLDTQNAGDFGSYKKYYAQKFEGIKRARDRVSKFDRAGWLKDRGRMFKKKMTVGASDVVVRSTDKTATVRFVQSWSSGRYSDQGPKRLDMVLEDGKLRISREEMLKSLPTPSLVAYVNGVSVGGELVKVDQVPAKAQAEIVALVDVTGEEGHSVGWLMRLSKGLVLVATRAKSVEGEYIEEPGQHALTLLKRQGPEFVIAGATSGMGRNYKLHKRADIDGDGADDVLVLWDWYHDHEGGEGLAVVTTKEPKVFGWALTNSASEGGEGGGTSLDDVCLATIEGRWALIILGHQWQSELIESRDPMYPETEKTSEPENRISVWDGKGFAPASIYGVLDPGSESAATFKRGCSDDGKSLSVLARDLGKKPKTDSLHKMTTLSLKPTGKNTVELKSLADGLSEPY